MSQRKKQKLLVGIARTPLQLQSISRYLAQEASGTRLSLLVINCPRGTRHLFSDATIKRIAGRIRFVFATPYPTLDSKRNKLPAIVVIRVRLENTLKALLISGLVALRIGIKKSPGVEKILLVGTITHPEHALSIRIASRLASTVVVDDGLGALFVWHARKSNPVAGGSSQPVPYSAAQHRQACAIRQLQLFTFFDLPSSSETQVIKDVSLPTVVKSQLPRTTWFLGSGFVPTGMVRESRYVELIAETLAKIGGGRMVYLPHPAESSAHFKNLRRVRGLEVLETGLAFEDFLLRAPNVPSTLVGFATSALITGSLMLPDSTASCLIRIPGDAILGAKNGQLIRWVEERILELPGIHHFD